MVPVQTMLEVPQTPDIPMSQAVPIIGELIPIIAIVLGIGIGMLWIYFDFRRKREVYQLYHAERMAAIEKGMELPPLPTDLFNDSRTREGRASRSRRRGLILLFLGVAICVGLWASGTGRISLWGLVPAGIGLALLLSSRLEAKEQASATGASDLNRGNGAPNPPFS
jgi:hypothetical protein